MVEVEDHTAILRSPTRKELGYAATVGKADPLKFNQTILEKTWLEGDEAIKTEDRLFMGVCEQLDQVVDTAEASIKKL